jgi:hypothetical protein
MRRESKTRLLIDRSCRKPWCTAGYKLRIKQGQEQKEGKKEKILHQTHRIQNKYRNKISQKCARYQRIKA